MVEQPRTLDEDDAPRAFWERAVAMAIVLIATYFVLAIMNPGMSLWPWDLPDFDRGWLLKDTTTNGGDMGAHVYWPWFLEHNWFGQFRLSGWSPDWYAGFPAGHYYFPLPAVLIALADSVPGVPYNIAFKVVTASGPLLLPAAAYSFARGLRAPWPAPPAFAIAAFGMLVQTRQGWQIYGGNVASTLAGEFSFTLSLALGLFALGALGHTLDTGKRSWLPAVLIAAAAMSHVVVAIFIAVVAVLLCLVRRPNRTWRLAIAVGGVALALTAVWTLPLLARENLTQSMRYTKEVPTGTWEMPGAVAFFVPGPVENTVERFVWAVSSSSPEGTSTDAAITDDHHLWLPWWMWALGSVAIVAAGWYRRRSTLVLFAAAMIFGVFFIQWPDGLAVWNTRFLPFWLLCWGFLAAMGAAEIVRLVALGARWAVYWVRDGDLHDSRARAWIALAGPQDGVVGNGTANGIARLDAQACATLRVRDDATEEEIQRAYGDLAQRYHPDAEGADEQRFSEVTAAYEKVRAQLAQRPVVEPDAEPPQFAPEEIDPLLKAEAYDVVAAQRWDRIPPNWETPERLNDDNTKRRAHIVGALALAVVVALGGWFGLKRAWNARDNNPQIAIEGWANWNYRGYEQKTAWPEYSRIMEVMGSLPCGRALWEPSAMEGDPINNYGTSLALELLPYFTDGCIGSMEGLYFESSATTSHHFLTVSELAQHPSNPVRGLGYGTLADDFDTGVEHLQMLGVRYYMTWTPEAQAKADADADLKLVATIPDLDNLDPRGWRVYEVADSALVEGLQYEPVVASTHGGTTSECFDLPKPEGKEAELDAWECSAAGWYRNADLLDTRWAASGPKDWKRVDIDELDRAPRERLAPVKVTEIREDPDKISFHVDKVGVPVVVKASYFPNWQPHGAKGPYRLAPNLMVVIPTEKDVSLTYGLTGVDWLGRILTLLGIAGVVLLVRWKGAVRYAADTPPSEPPVDGEVLEHPYPPEAGDDGAHPPDRTEPAPALP